AADSVFISGPTAQVGSIGIIATHIDQSQADAKQGIRVTEIAAGKYKGLASSHAPLSQDGKDQIQQKVDYLYGVFVETVARHRGVPVETVLKDMADGRVFIGQQAIDAGLVDGTATLEELINTKEQGMSNDITAASLKADHKDIYDAVLAEGHQAGLDEGAHTGAEAERQRIQSILEVQVEGFEDAVTAAIADGKTTGPEVAMTILKAQKARGVSLDGLAAESQLAGAAHPGADDADEQERAALVGAMAAGTGRKKEN
ncbi:MAG: S49 family peptidase, partial [Nitrospirota bacterium]|nr:S49 family peptidase [Nitrospirota bacterium]